MLEKNTERFIINLFFIKKRFVLFEQINGMKYVVTGN